MSAESLLRMLRGHSTRSLASLSLTDVALDERAREFAHLSVVPRLESLQLDRGVNLDVSELLGRAERLRELRGPGSALILDALKTTPAPLRSLSLEQLPEVSRHVAEALRSPLRKTLRRLTLNGIPLTNEVTDALRQPELQRLTWIVLSSTEPEQIRALFGHRAAALRELWQHPIPEDWFWHP